MLFLHSPPPFPFLLCFFLHLAVVAIAILVVVVVDIAYFRAFVGFFKLTFVLSPATLVMNYEKCY